MKKLLATFMLISNICLADKLWVYDTRVLSNLHTKVNEFIEKRNIKKIVIKPYVKAGAEVWYFVYVVYE